MTIRVGNIDVVLRTRDEHCPPHVHADCAGEGWSARYRFWFLSDDVQFWDFQPERPHRRPRQATLNEVGQAIYENLPAIRMRWWEVMGTVCLDNQLFVPIAQNQAQRTTRVLRIRGGSYEPIRQILRLILSDGSVFEKPL